ncbi:MAG: Ppx/GppA family phosphatase [Nitrospirae bacterium]|nr:Ppx/GppA family phosphatase [Nitrospirota bacterium]
MSAYASIDVGSNTFRLLIAEIKKGKIIDIFSDRKITRLGNKVNQTGRLQVKNIEESIKALKEFASMISKYNVVHIRAIATSALREASNSDTFIQRVNDETGIKIDVISGEKEAELNLKGILLSFSEPKYLNKTLLILDIGGGSTEWILYNGEHSIRMGSIPVGVIKFTENFLKTDPISNNDLSDMKNEMYLVIKKLEPEIHELIAEKTELIGTGGTFTTLASIDLKLDEYSREKIHMHRIPLSRLKKMSEFLLPLTLEERKKVKGLEPQRADLIIPGLLFTINVMDFFHFTEMIISDYGLLEGALLEIDEKSF